MSSEIKKKLLVVGFSISMLYALYFAMPLYLNSSVLSIYFSSSNVSIIFAVSALVALITSLSLAKFIRKLHSHTFAICVIFVGFFATLGLGYFENIYLIPVLFALHFSTSILLLNIINLFIEEFTERDNEGSTRGIFLTMINAGILISPLIAGQILSAYGYKWVYIASALMLIPVAYLIRHYYANIPDPIYKNVNMSMALDQVRRNKNLYGIMLATFLLESFFTMMAIYAPLYLMMNTTITLAQYIGIIIPFALIPFVLLPYELGYLADKKFGEKEMLITGLVIIIACSLLFPFLMTSSIFYLSIFLFISRIGAAMVETMSHTYFYKKVKVERVSVITLFNNVRTLAYIITPIVGGLIIALAGNMMYVFVVYAIISSLILVKVSKIKDTL